MRVYILSDIHYAGPAEQERRGHELRTARNPVVRSLLRFYRDHVWLKNPYDQNHLLDQFLDQVTDSDHVVANGDYSCDTAFIGVSDDAARNSAQLCLNQLRSAFGNRFHGTFGDHELGKVSLLGGVGGLRLASWKAAVEQLQLKPFWKAEIGKYVLVGVVSSLVALPVFEPETLPEERAEWWGLRKQHLAEINAFFESLRPDHKVVLFCHDPTALPLLWKEAPIRQRASQIEKTIIGHLHSPLILWKSHFLAGIPPIRFMGNSIRRFSEALYEARHWQEFNVQLCPSLAGIELLKDGGYLVMDLDPNAEKPLQIEKRSIPR